MLTPNEKDKSMTAPSQFKKLINYKILGTEIELNVIALKSSDSKVLYDDKTLCTISYNTPYMQSEVGITWNINENSVKELGLHYTYNTNFQKMSVKDSNLIIENNNGITIILKKGIEQCQN